MPRWPDDSERQWPKSSGRIRISKSQRTCSGSRNSWKPAKPSVRRGEETPVPQVTFMGHPLHPQLIVMPAGLLPFSLVLDALHVATRDQSYADAAYYTMMGGFVGGIAAGAAGAADYGTIPSDSKAKAIG